MGVSAGSIVVTPYNRDAEFNLQYVPAGSEMARKRQARGWSISRYACTWIAKTSRTLL